MGITRYRIYEPKKKNLKQEYIFFFENGLNIKLADY